MSFSQSCCVTKISTINLQPTKKTQEKFHYIFYTGHDIEVYFVSNLLVSLRLYMRIEDGSIYIILIHFKEDYLKISCMTIPHCPFFSLQLYLCAYRINIFWRFKLEHEIPKQYTFFYTLSAICVIQILFNCMRCFFDKASFQFERLTSTCC